MKKSSLLRAMFGKGFATISILFTLAAASAIAQDDDRTTLSVGLTPDERNAVSYPDGLESPDAKSIVLANQATGPKPSLYNGIELPLAWPPRHLDADSAEPMPVPYLQHPPKVIPIDVGRQLFVDDFLIESTTLKRTFHTAKKFAGNPVFKAETKHELAVSKPGAKGQEAVTYLGHGGVFFDPSEQHFKMFYTAGWRGPLALATSTDLKTWTRPELGILEDNLLLARGNDAGGDNSVWLDLASKEARIKLLTDHGPNGHTLRTSSDGRTWSQPVSTGKAADYCSIFHNPFRNVWCYSIKQGGRHGRNRTNWSFRIVPTQASRPAAHAACIPVPASASPLCVATDSLRWRLRRNWERLQRGCCAFPENISS